MQTRSSGRLSRQITPVQTTTAAAKTDARKKVAAKVIDLMKRKEQQRDARIGLIAIVNGFAM